MPLPFVDSAWLPDAAIFPALNAVALGYCCLIFLPGWRHTTTIVHSLILGYSLLYGLLLAARLAALPAFPLPDGAGIDTLAGVVALFSDPPVVFAGWTHYIAFDLFVSSHIVRDARTSGVPHLVAVWTVPVTLMAGPAGFAAYSATKALWLRTPGLRGRAARLAPVRHLAASWREFPVSTALYCGVSGLSVFMVQWVLFSPSSWLVGNSSWHDAALSKAMEGAVGVVPRSLVFKYAGHRAIQFSHTLPSALWSACIPLQLYPGLRRSYPRLHRWSGYSFIGSGLLMMCGLLIIDQRQLYYYSSDFPEIPHHQHMTRFPRLFGSLPHRRIFLGLGAYFSATLLYSLYNARQRRFAAHRRFIYRHIGSGIWVAVQRLYVFVQAAMSYGVQSQEEQKANFGDGAVLGAMLTLALAEVGIWAAENKAGKAQGNAVKRE